MTGSGLGPLIRPKGLLRELATLEASIHPKACGAERETTWSMLRHSYVKSTRAEMTVRKSTLPDEHLKMKGWLLLIA